jgi:hypothetical protein
VELRVVRRGAPLQARRRFFRLSLLQLFAPVALDLRDVERGVRRAGDLRPNRLREASEVGAVEIPGDAESRLGAERRSQRLARLLAATPDVEGPGRFQIQVGLLLVGEPGGLRGARVFVPRFRKEARIEGTLGLGLELRRLLGGDSRGR